MKQLMMFFSLVLLLSFVSFAQTRTTQSDKDRYVEFSYDVATIDSSEADTSSTFALNTFLTGSSTVTNPFSFWYNVTVASTGGAADSVLMYIIFDAYHNTTWGALDTVSLDVSGTSTSGSQLMDFNNLRSPDNKYRIRAVVIDDGSAVTSFKSHGIVIKPAQ